MSCAVAAGILNEMGAATAMPYRARACARTPEASQNEGKISISSALRRNLIALCTLTSAATQQEDISMAEVRYLVIQRNGEWKISSGNFRMGPYRDRIQAIDAAIDMADRDGRNGRDSQVLVRGDDRQLRIEWTYGRDPYPDSVALD
jgi:hypothetical protein